MNKEEKKRTAQQNRALHKLFNDLAEELNERGVEQRQVVEILEKYSTVPWNGTTIKEIIWRPIQMALLLKKSTTELTTKEIDEVFEVLSREVLTPLGITDIHFPSIQELINQQRYDKQ